MSDALRLLNAISGSYYFAIGLFYPLYASFIEGIGGSAFIAGTAFSIYSIAAGAMIYFFARWENQHDHKDAILVIGYALATLCFAGYYYVSNPIHMFLVQGLLGVSVAMRTPAFDDIYSKAIPGNNYARGWGSWEAMYWTINGVSAFIGGAIIQRYGFDPVFIAMTGLGVVSTVLSYRFMVRTDLH